MSRALLILFAALLVCLSVSIFGENFIASRYAYYYDVLITIGINVILATSLNLVNGYTGQFSLGHAGFMAIGAYPSASWSNHLDPYIVGWIGGAGNPFATNVAFAQAKHPVWVRGIDAALATAQLTSAQRAEVVKLRNDGERMHNAGNHAGAEVALQKARSILKIH